RATKNDPWEQPTNLGPVVNSSASESAPFLSSDGLLLFFSEDKLNPIRPGGFGNQDIWVTRRASISDPWGAPMNLGPIVNSPSLDGVPQISPDGSTLYFSSERPGGFGGSWWGDIYQTPIIPIVDFNADEIVDSADMCIMVDYWGTDNPLCDIGPMPWGDGIVDVEDLKVLAEYLFGDVQCVAHFMLDESKGNIANDSARNRDGTVHGDPAWQPMSGIIGGALQLDGNDDYIKTGFILNPTDSELSVFTWIKDGFPNQVVLSQIGGTNWLMTDNEGNLMTELQDTGRAGKPLQSQANITDGEWHRIGLVWDGSNRVLYVDSVEVVKDTQTGLEGSGSGLYIGCGTNMEPGTYWSGLIDDVRIYNRVVTP
ncbi:MAG: LamG-like jellyroll fold domain-containing protein, partial [Planctomycetota bacterium]